MWSVIGVLFAVGSCVRAEVYNVTEVALPSAPAPSTRIIGGVPTTIERYPYAVQVLYNNQLSCAGSLLTRRHVLSAAHCFVDGSGRLIDPRNLRIRVGTAALNSGGSSHRVSTIIIHERYNIPLRDNDVAVLLLSSAVTLGVRAAAAVIARQGFLVPNNAIVTYVGWGQTNINVVAAAPVLNEVSVFVVNHAVCQARYADLQIVTNAPFYVTDSMICAGVLDVGGRDACQGDSGGPLIYNGQVVGITSWGYGCGHPRYPGVSAKVASYTNWINQTVIRYNAAPSLTNVNAALLLASLIAAVLRI